MSLEISQFVLKKFYNSLGSSKSVSSLKSLDLIDHAMMYNKDSFFSSRLEGVAPFP